VIYCVIPREWVDDLYDRMVTYYAENPDVTVIVDRRHGGKPRADGYGPHEWGLRDRRRVRLVGTFPATDPPGI
jgi:hypothetical protein